MVQWLRLCAAKAGGTGLIPGGGTKIPHERVKNRTEKKKKKTSEGEVSWLFTLLCWCYTCPGSPSGKELTCHCKKLKRCRFGPWIGKMPWRRKWHPAPVFLPGESHGQRSRGATVCRVVKSQTQWSNLARPGMLTCWPEANGDKEALML